MARFPYVRGRLAVNPVGEFVALPYSGRRLLGEVIAVRYDCGPVSGYVATVKHFNGEPWPLEPCVGALEWIKQD